MKTVEIEKHNLIFQAACAILILMGVFFTRSLMWLAAVMSVVYMFSNVKWEQKIAFFVFLVLFSPIFKLSADQTSFLTFSRIALIACFLFKNKEKISSAFIIALIAFFAYSMALSSIFNTSDYIVTLINIALWLFAGYVIVSTLTMNNVTPVTRSLSNAVLITGVIGLFINEIPILKEEIGVLFSYAEDGAIVSRYAGFFKDPNFFTVLLTSSLWFIYYEFDYKRLGITEFLTRCILASFLGLFTMSKSCILLLIVFWTYVLISKNDIKTPSKVILFFSLLIAVGIFMVKNPYWFSDLFFRFTGSSDELDANVITTGRTNIWRVYTRKMLDNFSWIFGNGIGCKLPREKGSHNTLIQIIYTLGIVGSGLYIYIFRCMYNSSKSVKNNILYRKFLACEKMSFISFFIAFMFLDGLNIEIFYYMLPLSLVYILGTNHIKVKEIADEEPI